MVLILGHRGAPRCAVENTIAAFVGAARLGADGVELDVRRTGDGALAVHHDPAIPGLGPIAQLPCAALPPDIPLLEEALDACHGLLVNIEIKNSPLEPHHDPQEQAAAAVVALLGERGRVDRVAVSSFSLSTIDAVKAADPTVPTALITLPLLDQAWALDTAGERGHEALHPEERAVTAELVEKAAAAGMAVRPWTVDVPARMAELAAYGVDAVVTNEVELAVATLRPRLPAAP